MIHVPLAGFTHLPRQGDEVAAEEAGKVGTASEVGRSRPDDVPVHVAAEAQAFAQAGPPEHLEIGVELQRLCDLRAEVDAVGLGHLLLQAMVEDKTVLSRVRAMKAGRVLIDGGELGAQELGEPGRLMSGGVVFGVEAPVERKKRKTTIASILSLPGIWWMW